MYQPSKEEKIRINRSKFDWLINLTEYGVKKYFNEYLKAYCHNYQEDAVDNKNSAFCIPDGQAEDRLFLLLLEKNPNLDKLLSDYKFDFNGYSKLRKAENYYENKLENINSNNNIKAYLTLRNEIQDFINELKSKISLFELFVEHFFAVTQLHGIKSYKSRYSNSNVGGYNRSVNRAIYYGHLFPKSNIIYEDNGLYLRNKSGEIYRPIKYIVSTPNLMEGEAGFDANEPLFLRTINSCNGLYARYMDDYRLLKEHIDFFKDKSIDDTSIYDIQSHGGVGGIVYQIRQDLKKEQKLIDEKERVEKLNQSSTASKLIELSICSIKVGVINYGDSGVYLIVNNKTQDFYIGESQNMKVRKKTHVGDLTLGEHHSKLMQKHFNKYGIGAFDFYCLEIFPTDNEALRKYAEKRWIKEYQPTYNTNLS